MPKLERISVKTIKNQKEQKCSFFVGRKYKIEISELEKEYKSIEPLGVRIEKIKNSIRKLLDISYNGVDEKIIEEFVDKIIVHKDYFEWKLNFMNDTIKLGINGTSKKDGFLIKYK